MDDHGRRYERYDVRQDRESQERYEAVVDGQEVRLLNFSVGGLYVLSKTLFPKKEVQISVKFKDRGIIELPGCIVRVQKEGDMWGLAIDLTKTYALGKSK